MVQRRKAQATMAWPSVPGMIHESKLVYQRDAEGRNSPAASVTYSYAINGAPFYGNQIRVGGGGSNYKALLNRYRAGSPVQVFFDPRNPAAAVLERGAAALWVWPVVGAVAVVIGLGAMAR
jgi:hypothetical protein